MAWGPPSIPISGQTITVAFATALLNSLNWLRQLTGNGDPPAADRIIVSTSTSTSTWQQVTTAVIATGAVTDAKMSSLKVNQVNPIYTTFGAPLTEGSGFYDISSNPGDGPLGATGRWLLNQVRHWNWGADYRWQLTCDMDNAANIYSRSVIGGAGSAWHRMFHSGMDGDGSGIDADLLDGVQGSGYAPIANQVPSGMIAAFATAAAIPAGWTRYTAADGRILVGAGTTFSQTFSENNNAGSLNWTPASGLSATVGTLTTNASTTGSASAANAREGTGANIVTPDHSHTIPSLSLSGAPTIAGTGNAWVPPSRVVVHAQKT